jgi:uncharacterized protein (TIGR02271 family)
MGRNEAIQVIDEVGHRGVVETMDEKSVRVRMEDGRSLVIPRDSLIAEAENIYRVDLDLYRLQTPTGEQVVVPLVAESLHIDKQAVERTVRVHKHVREETVTVDEALRRDDVTVERVPVDRYVEQRVETRYDGDTIIVPVMEEVLVVEKRLLLREEIHITRRQTVTHDPQEHTLRREEVTVERTNPSNP